MTEMLEVLVWWLLLPALAVVGSAVGIVVGFIIHELGHALAGLLVGHRPASINVMEVRFDEVARGWRLRCIAAGGPAASLGLAAFTIACAIWLYGLPWDGVIGWITALAFWSLAGPLLSGLVGIWNLKPGIDFREKHLTDGFHILYPDTSTRLWERWIARSDAQTLLRPRMAPTWTWSLGPLTIDVVKSA